MQDSLLHHYTLTRLKCPTALDHLCKGVPYNDLKDSENNPLPVDINLSVL